MTNNLTIMTCDICKDDQFPADMTDGKLVCIRCRQAGKKKKDTDLLILMLEVMAKVRPQSADFLHEVKGELFLYREYLARSFYRTHCESSGGMPLPWKKMPDDSKKAWRAGAESALRRLLETECEF